ncbi:preprotein translocase subunit SecE [Aliidiomarina haloalkalitolerans]|uniref:Protein translocase subunit SecE n=1 Tax=Aliidiomarina haloalkalitolerans TaxID=859059 RepID=A0A432VPD7_9GAMM|nr:preprotein translocase subunit SecE [Aliidiomarina haloalkalitolerans]RUO18019.1 preprotein translocase subunit SecE [Aliidiomarina haloalkalitolerans]
MSVNTENQTNSLDLVKWVAVAALLSAAVIGNYIFDDLSVVLRALGVVVLVVVAGLVAAQTNKGKTFLGFAKESRTEVRKVVWPTRKEASQTTLIVIVATVIVALILWGLDGIFVRVVGLATGIRI